ncbi:MAG TPA: glycosyltransferase family 4 protein [Syntrophobacteraceae bacterium]|nr:glycosyltransferase family 4 protein [Syntrophobacteraceae bacterium]
MLLDKRLLLLINWEEEGRWDLYRSIRDRWKRVIILQPYRVPCPGYGTFNRFSTWASEMYLPFLALCKRRQADVVVSWSMRMGVCYGILNRLFPGGNRCRHVLYDFHINLRKKGAGYRRKLRLLRFALGGIDFFLCTSNREADLYSHLFRVPRERIRFFPMTPPRHYLDAYDFPRKDYVLSYGNSDRDYDSLVTAAKESGLPTVILTQTYRFFSPLPSNVRVIRERTVGLDLIRLIASARLVVLPLRDAMVSAGQTAMLETMALGRPLIVSANPATAEYAQHGRDALFFEPGDARALKERMLFLWEHPGEAERLGARARESALEFPNRQVAVFLDTLENLLL